MKVSAQILKNALKKLSVLSSDLYIFDGKKVYATAPNLILAVDFKNDLGVFAVGAQKFGQLIARLDGDIDLSIIMAKIVIKAKKSKLSLSLIAEPRIPVCPELNNLIQVPYKELMDGINYVVQATEKGQFFNYTGSLNISNEYTAASDGKRLAVALNPFQTLGNPILLPVPAAQALKSLESKNIGVGQDETNIYFRSDDATLVSRKLAKSFPDFAKLLPKELNFKYKFDREELRTALRGLEPLADDKILLTFENGSCTLVLASTAGEGETVVAFEQLSPDPLFEEIKFSGKYNFSHIQDFVESVSKEVIFGANTENGPVFLESGNKKLIMAAQQ